MTELTMPPEQWLRFVRTNSARLNAWLREVERRPEMMADGALQQALAEMQVAAEELHATEAELRVQAAAMADAEAALDQARRRHDQLFDFLPDACFITDASAVIREANHATSSLIGYARGYALRKPLLALIHQEDGPAFAARLERLRAAENDRPQSFEVRLRGKRTGAPLPVRVYVAPMRGADGSLAGFRWLLRDVAEETERAERLRAMEEAHASELRTRTMELEAIARMQAARLEDCARAHTELRRVAADAHKALQHGAEPRALLVHVLDALARTTGDGGCA